jgi:hypothetical protein
MRWSAGQVVGAFEETAYQLTIIFEGVIAALLIGPKATGVELEMFIIGGFALFLFAFLRYIPPFPPGPNSWSDSVAAGPSNQPGDQTQPPAPAPS